MKKYNLQQLRSAWGAGKLQHNKQMCVEKGESPELIGKWFHSFDDDKIKWQGRILSSEKNDSFLVQLFEWFGGTPSKQILVPFSDMLNWNFYSSAEEMIEAWKNKQKIAHG